MRRIGLALWGLCHRILQQGTQKFHRVLDVGVKLLRPGTARFGPLRFPRVSSHVLRSGVLDKDTILQNLLYQKLYETKGVSDTKQQLYQKCVPAAFAPNICHTSQL